MPRAAPHPYDAAMRQAIDVARLADQSGDVPVGAVVLDPAGALLGSGHNAREALGDPTAHAEVMALRQAATSLGRWRLEGCTLVVTLEPCTMCAGAVVLARLSTLVFGAYDPKAGAVGNYVTPGREPSGRSGWGSVEVAAPNFCSIGRSGSLLRGGVSERPKEHASKACVGASQPWVQIPPPPPHNLQCSRQLRAHAQGLTLPLRQLLVSRL
jgi:tRNA(adenine34) deaminase